MNLYINFFLSVLLGWVMSKATHYSAIRLSSWLELPYHKCPHCGLMNQIVDPNSPLVCGRCENPLNYNIFSIFLFSVFTFFLLMINQVPPISFAVFSFVVFYFAIVAIIDIRHHMVLNFTAYLGVIIGLVVGGSVFGFPNSLFGLAIGFLFMLVIYWFGMIHAKLVKSKLPSMGFGDVLLGGVLGSLLGYPLILPGMILYTFISAISSSITMYLIKTKRLPEQNSLPQAPTMIFGCYLAFVISVIL